MFPPNKMTISEALMVQQYCTLTPPQFEILDREYAMRKNDSYLEHERMSHTCFICSSPMGSSQPKYGYRGDNREEAGDASSSCWTCGTCRVYLGHILDLQFKTLFEFESYVFDQWKVYEKLLSGKWEKDDTVIINRTAFRLQIFNAAIKYARVHAKNKTMNIEQWELPTALSEPLIPILDKISAATGCYKKLPKGFTLGEKVDYKEFTSLDSMLMFIRCDAEKQCLCCQHVDCMELSVCQLSPTTAEVVLGAQCKQLVFCILQIFELPLRFKSAGELAEALQKHKIKHKKTKAAKARQDRKQVLLHGVHELTTAALQHAINLSRLIITPSQKIVRLCDHPALHQWMNNYMEPYDLRFRRLETDLSQEIKEHQLHAENALRQSAEEAARHARNQDRLRELAAARERAERHAAELEHQREHQRAIEEEAEKREARGAAEGAGGAGE